jgi:hypothetical protein
MPGDAMIQIHNNPTRGQLRLFAALWFPLFLLVAGTVARNAGAPREVVWGVWIAGGTVSVLGVLVPRTIWFVFVGLSYAVLPVGLVVSTVVLAGVYYLVVTPIALLRRGQGHDAMQRRLDREAKSYWQNLPEPGDPSSYFQQW